VRPTAGSSMAESEPEASDQPKAAVFFYDFYSPYSYLAAERVNAVMPVVPEWRPISFGHILKQSGRRPWSFDQGDDHDAHWAEIDTRATDRGLPGLKRPAGWPIDSYSVIGARAATFAKGSGRAVAYSLALFRQIFAAGRTLDEATVLIAGAACELHPNALLKGIESRSVKDELVQTTNAAYELGVRGVPTIAVDGELFWGDDQLEDAAAAARG
jgi:2-hydroxychromene-2-carboxylate isomerase